MDKSKKRKLKPEIEQKQNEQDFEIQEQVFDPQGFCVGIGASAGGLEALEQFFRNMPPDSGLSFVVVQHLSPDYKSLMVELLSKHTSMKVFRAEDGAKVLPNCIYLIPPKKNMTIFHGKLFLTEQDHQYIINLPIDIFFRSLAEDYADKSIGIILSGTGSDGTLGIRAIKGIGGMVMAQDDSSAKFDGMPKSAISTGLVDYILPAEKMPEELLKYVKHPLTLKGDEQPGTVSAENTLGKILSIIRNNTGVDFTYYKPNTIVRRLERRISINQISSYENYTAYLEQSPREVNILYKELLIGVTKFFRDTESFEILKQKVIPNIFLNKKKDEPIRVWSVGSSTGEEAYSLAILLKEYMEISGVNHDIKIFATDLDKESIEYGSLGFYPESIVADVSAERLKSYFLKKDKGYQIKESVRKMVIFATHNIIKDPPFSKIDLISCRNMLIYLKPVMQKKVLSLFHFSLTKNGYLFLGSSESLGDLSKNFTTINSKWKIYSYKEGYTPDTLGDFLLPSVTRTKPMQQLGEFQIKSSIHTTDISDSIFNTIIEEFLPPSVIVDENFEIVHICKDVNKYIHLPSGKVTYDILSLVRKELSTAISIALHKALKEDKEIIYNDFKLKESNEVHYINIKVKPFRDRLRTKRLIFIFFEEKKTVQNEPGTIDQQTIEYDSIQQIKDLELELKYTKENLQATIEELGTSNEELQATNEELISSNEELQSTNEELQSVNEELYTVNSEYQSKIEVLTQLNNDINNLLKNTNIGTVFLDRNLLIRKFTPAVTSAINILEMDIGRPIHHISHNTFYDKFLEDIENVLRTLIPKENEVKGKKNNWFLMRILPYRTIDNAIDGVVITFFDITERKNFEERIERKNNLLLSVLDNSPIANAILNKEGKITYANHMAEKVLGLTIDEIITRKYNAPLWRITAVDGGKFPDEQLPFYLVSKTGRPVFDVVHNIEWPDGMKKTLSINASPVFDENNQVDGVICTLLDITEKLFLEEMIKREHDLFMRILENSHHSELLFTSKGELTFANKIARQLLQIDMEKATRHHFSDLKLTPSINLKNYGNILEMVVKTGQTAHNIQHRILGSDYGQSDILYLTASPVFGENQSIEGIVLSIDRHNDLVINSDLMIRQISSLSNMIEMGIFTVDINSTITSWNNKAEQLSGILASDVKGKKCLTSDAKGGAKSNIPCLQPENAGKHKVCRNIVFDTGTKKVSINAKKMDLIKNEKDQVIGAIGYFDSFN